MILQRGESGFRAGRIAVLIMAFTGPSVAHAQTESPSARPSTTEVPTAQPGVAAQALTSARQLVDLTEQQHGRGAKQLVDPLLGLATAQQDAKDDIGAERNYRRVVAIAEIHEGANSHDLIAALAGLGGLYAENRDYDASVQTLRRAIDLSRKLDGLFNPQQLDLMYSLIASYLALGDYDSVLREQPIALQIAMDAFGKDMPRLVGELERHASWFESMGRYATARRLHAQTLSIASNLGQQRNLMMVEPLRGIARDHQFEFLYGMENRYVDASGKSSRSHPNREGEAALQLALEIIDAHPESGAAERAKALLDLGDWRMFAGYRDQALQVYREAWVAATAPEAGGTAAFDAPLQVYYRPPGGTTTPTFGDKFVEQFAEVEFTVAADGSVNGVTLVESGVPEKTARLLVRAIKAARYRPRFVNGSAVATSGTRFRERFYGGK